MANKMAVQEFLYEIVADQDFLISNSSALTHVYPVHAHRASETESEGSDLAPVSDVEMDVDENDQDFTPPEKTHPKIGGKIKSE